MRCRLTTSTVPGLLRKRIAAFCRKIVQIAPDTIRHVRIRIGPIGTVEYWVTPQPLFVACARPMVACRFEPLQVLAESDMTVQPLKFVVGPPLLRTAVPL